MQLLKQRSFPKTVVLRHRRENLKKCSLRGLENRDDFIFFSYPYSQLPVFDNTILLTLDAPPLSKEDGEKGLFVIDATWRYAEKMVQKIIKEQSFIHRSIPSHFRTAYPRRQEDCSSPERGLSSIEAIYIAYTILGRDTEGLLDNYVWKEMFLYTNNF